MDHRAEFELLILKRYGQESADAIDWKSPRLICIACDFTKYDGHAVQQMNRSIQLIRYKQFGSDLLLLELVNATSSTLAVVRPVTPTKVTSLPAADSKPATKGVSGDKTVEQWAGVNVDGTAVDVRLRGRLRHVPR